MAVSAGGHIPPELKWTLRNGSVFYFVARELHSTDPHYMVVINRDPLGENLLLLCVFTSKVEKLKFRHRENPQTIVEVSPVEYLDLRVPSAIDCNYICRRSLEQMAQMIREKKIGYQRDLPASALERVRQAVLASPMVEDEDKDRVR